MEKHTPSGNYSWLSIEIFIQTPDWHYVVRNIIKPFINEINTTVSIHHYHLHFICELRPSITISFLNPVSTTDLQYDQIKTSWEAHLKRKPGKNLLFRYSDSQSLFYHIIGDPLTFYFARELSDLVLDLSKHLHITDDLLFNIALHLQLSYIKSLTEIQNISINDIIPHGYLCEYVLQNDNLFETLETMDQLFNQDKHDLMRLYAQIFMSTGSTCNLPEWYPEWHKISTKIMIDAGKTQTKALTDITRYFCSNLINNQLGLNNFSKFILNYFITRIIGSAKICSKQLDLFQC